MSELKVRQSPRLNLLNLRLIKSQRRRARARLSPRRERQTRLVPWAFYEVDGYDAVYIDIDNDDPGYATPDQNFHQKVTQSLAWAQRPSELLSSKDAPIALVLDVDFVFAIPKSRAKKLKPGDPHVQRPDRGNLLKMVEDVLEDIAYADDCVIADGRVRKVWGERDETRLTLRRA